MTLFFYTNFTKFTIVNNKYDIKNIKHTKDSDIIENRNVNKTDKRRKEYKFR